MKNGWKNTAGGLLALAAVLTAALLVFRGHWQEIRESLESVPLCGALALAALAAGYQLLESGVCASLVRVRLPGFSFRQAVEVTFLGVFGNVATFAVGSMPMQSLLLHKYGLSFGHGVGLLTVDYIFHKTSILLYATVMLLFQGTWLREACPDLSRYLLLGYGVCTAIVAALVLLCTWGRLEHLAVKLIGLLPETGKWPQRKEAWRTNLEALYTQSQHVLKDRARCGRILALNAMKLLSLYTAAWLSIWLLGAETPDFWQAQLLAALMLLISSALPNVAGVGPTEFAFLMLFARFMPYAQASAAMLLYRTATYFFPFAVSIAAALWVQRRQFSGFA
ncbi:MAG: flippase-like domain-containing protein [Oscillospiraceae bacterium]|nr:flippase-like domain-containing protein [Oscillospiraceae bacterium]